MSRAGSALFVAIVVVLLGGMVAVLAAMTAISEVRSGTSWRDQQGAVGLATGVLARSKERAESLFDSLGTGESGSLTGNVTLMRLSDSVGLLTTTARAGSGEEVTSLIVMAGDSAGTRRLTVPGSRVRFHPIR